MQEAFERLQILDANGVPVDGDGAHRGERFEASRHVHADGADHRGDVVFAKSRPR
jgi:hypothetical protein